MIVSCLVSGASGLMLVPCSKDRVLEGGMGSGKVVV